MAADAVDTVVERARRRASTAASAAARPPRSCACAAPTATTSWPPRTDPRTRHLANRYGGEAHVVLAMIERDAVARRAARRRHRLRPGRGGLRRPLRDGPHPHRRARPAHPGPAPGPRRVGRGRARRSPRSSAPSSAGTTPRSTARSAAYVAMASREVEAMIGSARPHVVELGHRRRRRGDRTRAQLGRLEHLDVGPHAQQVDGERCRPTRP